MRNGLLLGLGLLSTVNANSFDDLKSPKSYTGFTITVEYNLNDSETVRKFYQEIMDARPIYSYFKINNSNLDVDQLPAVIVRCDENIVYESYGRTPPKLIWNIAINYFIDVLDRESRICR